MLCRIKENHCVSKNIRKIKAVLVILALVLCNVELCVQVIQQSVRAFLTQRVIHISLTRHDVKQITGNLQWTDGDESFSTAIRGEKVKYVEITRFKWTHLKSSAQVFHGAAIWSVSNQCETVGAFCWHHPKQVQKLNTFDQIKKHRFKSCGFI